MGEPLYSSEYVDAAQHVVRRFLLPRLFDAADVTAGRIAPLLMPVKGHPMAKAAVEMAVLDAELRQAGQALAAFFCAPPDRVPFGGSARTTDSVAALRAGRSGDLAAGYGRVKVNIG